MDKEAGRGCQAGRTGPADFFRQWRNALISGRFCRRLPGWRHSVKQAVTL